MLDSWCSKYWWRFSHSELTMPLPFVSFWTTSFLFDDSYLIIGRWYLYIRLYEWYMAKLNYLLIPSLSVNQVWNINAFSFNFLYKLCYFNEANMLFSLTVFILMKTSFDICKNFLLSSSSHFIYTLTKEIFIPHSLSHLIGLLNILSDIQISIENWFEAYQKKHKEIYVPLCWIWTFDREDRIARQLEI